MGASRACLLLLLVLVAGSAWEVGVARAASAQCEKEKNMLINACKPVVFGRPPSAYCCQRVRVTQLGCICPIITPKMAALIDINRAIRVVQGCGRPVPRHYKCGSITTP